MSDVDVWYRHEIECSECKKVRTVKCSHPDWLQDAPTICGICYSDKMLKKRTSSGSVEK